MLYNFGIGFSHLNGKEKYIKNERKSEQAHIPHAPTLLEMAIPSIRDGQSDKKGDINCSSKGSNQHFL